MLRRKFLAVAMAAGMAISMPAMALTEGVEYVKLPSPIPDVQNTVIKVFSYNCIFCYRFALSIDKNVMNELDLKYIPYPLQTMGKYGPQCAQLLAVALVKDESEGLTPLDPKSSFSQIALALYTAYHRNKERWDAGVDAFLKTGFDAVGWTRDQFDRDLKAAKVQDRLQRWSVADSIAHLQGVPAYIINGKYLLVNKHIRSTNDMIKTIKSLAAK